MASALAVPAMTIFWINKRNWRYPGPIVNIAAHNAHSFAALGLETHLYLGAGEPSDTAQDLSEFYSLDAPPTLHIHRIQRGKSWGVNESGPIFGAARQHILAAAKKGRVVVFSREAGFLFIMARLGHYPNIRCFYELHDFYADLSWHTGRVPLRFHREKWQERLFLPFISGLVCITSDQERNYRRLFPRATTIYTPLGTKEFPATDPEVKRKARTVFYVGHMHGAKGVAFLRKAAIALAQAQIRTEFWGGANKDVQPILKTAREMGLQDWISAVTFQPPATMHQALAERASLGVVMLADTYYNRHLTCPVKALDYLSHGIPALGTDIPSVRDVLAGAGNYIAEGDIEAFVTQAKSLLDDPAAYARAVADSRARCKEITWQQRAQSLGEFTQKRF